MAVFPECLCKDRFVFYIVNTEVTAIIIGSLLNGGVPAHLKHAVVKPLPKKANLDLAVLANFRLSKLLLSITPVILLDCFRLASDQSIVQNQLS